MFPRPVGFYVYRSRLLRTMSKSELDTMLARARDRNDDVGITGYLILEDGYFYQYFEGPLTTCDALMASLQNDARHTDIKILGSGLCYDRRFRGWSMGAFTSGTLSAATPGACRSMIGRQLKYANGETVIEHLQFVAGRQWELPKRPSTGTMAKVFHAVPARGASRHHADNDRYPAYDARTKTRAQQDA